MIDYTITGMVIFLVGFVLTFFPPEKKMNKYGYNTKAARHSKEHWVLAQKLAGRYFLVVGILSIASGVALFHQTPNGTSRLISILISVSLLLVAVYLVERRLKEKV
ncbi:MAG: SdpI family protein [Cyclobacteriaceae bacterium]